MRTILIGLIITMMFIGCGQQETETSVKEIIPLHLKNPKTYYFGIIEGYPDKADIPEEEVNEIQKQHLANITRLANEGSMKLAGPFWLEGNVHTVRGLFLYDVPTIDSAKVLVATDPAVQNNRLVVRVLPWLGSANMCSCPQRDRK